MSFAEAQDVISREENHSPTKKTISVIEALSLADRGFSICDECAYERLEIKKNERDSKNEFVVVSPNPRSVGVIKRRREKSPCARRRVGEKYYERE